MQPLVGLLPLILHHPLYRIFHSDWGRIYLKYKRKLSIEHDRSSSPPSFIRYAIDPPFNIIILSTAENLPYPMRFTANPSKRIN
ncbi:hypothetical protein I7I53_03933 [Histoplasma capsulatum var. duboisii H88]|uniref:Uncharacterized protein n=1 Tax=Ajellomyces capsulatus (strain H88) TaxID=544711 RepID=A0A8A1LPR0_AJEC8|nr:hypothetical protein I7I53_03933 [Histoplasma capsulatum var. duboisii H88]